MIIRTDAPWTHPLTGTPAALAAFTTSSKRCKLSSTEQFMFFLLNSSDAAPNMATSAAPAFTWHKGCEPNGFNERFRRDKLQKRNTLSALSI